MCKQSEPVYLVRDDTLYSERDGSPAIYWSPANSWAAFRGASAVELSWSVLAADPTALVRVFVQTSLDGKSWDDDTGTDGLVSAGIAVSSNPRGAVVPYYLGTSPGAAFVRFGVQVSDISSSPGPVSARMTLVVTPQHGGGEVVYAYGRATDTLGVNDDVGPTLRVIDVAQMSLIGELFEKSGTIPSGSSVELAFHTAASPSGPWLALSTTLTVTDLNPVALASALKDQLSNYVQVRVLSVTGASSTLCLNLTGTVRPGC